MGLLFMAAMASAQVSISVPSGLDIELGGEVELEFVDVEGEGGFDNKDLTYQKVKTRSPHMRIDKAVLGIKVNYSENLSYTLEYRFDDDDAKIDKHYARLNVPAINTRFEFGNNRPLVATKRYTEGYPLIGTAYWKGRELHLTSISKFNMGGLKLNLGFSTAMKRAFATDDLAEDKSFKMMTYGNYSPNDGQTMEYGIKAGAEFAGILGEGWFYLGELMDDYDWKTSLSQGLNGYDELGDEEDKTHFWYGGRLTGDWGPLHVRTEYIYSKDGLLPREGAYAEAGIQLPENLTFFIPVKSVSMYGRSGFLNLIDVPLSSGTSHEWAYLAEPMSWSRQMNTISAIFKLNDFITVKAEYYVLNEDTGGDIKYYNDAAHTIESTTETSYSDDSNTYVKDNQALIQINFAF